MKKLLIAVAVMMFCLTGCKSDANKINDVNLVMSFNNEAVDGTIENDVVLFPGSVIGKEGNLTLDELETMGYSISSKNVNNTLYINVLEPGVADSTDNPVSEKAEWEQVQANLIAGTTKINLNDPNNLFPDDTGKMQYPIVFAPEASILVRDDFVYDEERTPVYNINYFKDIIHDIDTSIFLENGNLLYNGGSVITLSYDESTGLVKSMVPVWGFDYPSLELALPAFPVSRILQLNSMVFFGGEDMAKAVYGMLDEHYRFRDDNDKPITSEFAAKYGLTVNSDTAQNEDGTYRSMDVTNGESSWIVQYWTANSLGYDDVTVFMPR